jgi:hypothetical protein
MQTNLVWVDVEHKSLVDLAAHPDSVLFMATDKDNGRAVDGVTLPFDVKNDLAAADVDHLVIARVGVDV